MLKDADIGESVAVDHGDASEGNEYIQVILFFTKIDFNNINFPNNYDQIFQISILNFYSTMSGQLFTQCNGTFLVWLNLKS